MHLLNTFQGFFLLFCITFKVFCLFFFFLSIEIGCSTWRESTSAIEFKSRSIDLYKFTTEFPQFYVPHNLGWRGTIWWMICVSLISAKANIFAMFPSHCFFCYRVLLNWHHRYVDGFIWQPFLVLLHCQSYRIPWYWLVHLC